MKYKSPLYHKISIPTIIQWTDEEYARYKLDSDNVHAENLNTYHESCTKLSEAKKIIKEIFGDHSKEYKYVNKLWIERPINSWMNSVDVPRERHREKLIQEKQRQDKEAADKKLLEDAILWLQSHAYVLGKDFTVETAIYMANKFALDQEIKAADANAELHPVPFSGDENCENCDGWRGSKYHRCECGNRRVAWSTYDFDFRQPQHLYAEAY